MTEFYKNSPLLVSIHWNFYYVVGYSTFSFYFLHILIPKEFRLLAVACHNSSITIKMPIKIWGAASQKVLEHKNVSLWVLSIELIYLYY